MILHACSHYRHGDIKDGKSHCGREAVYSHLTNCIHKKALECYLEQMAVREPEMAAVVNR